ncbi:MAG TPA: hypothetical protein P5079_00140 [Elusimicrobiota bacterium]|nr:hypothetical protein [Elusimicrobiota bacterium]
MSQVLIVARDPAVRDQLKDVARQAGVTVDLLEDFDPAFAAIEREPPVLVFAENPPSDDVMEQLRKTLKVHAPVTPLLLYLPERNSALALKRMTEGAYDCLSSPVTPGDFLAAAKRSVSRLGRRLLTSRQVRPAVWWRRPAVVAAFSVLMVAGFLVLGVLRFWSPPFQIFKLASDHPVAVGGDEDTLWVADWSQQNLTRVAVRGDYLSIVQVNRFEDFQPVASALAPYYAYTASADGRLRRHRLDDALSSVALVPSPGPSPSGLAWDGAALWSCDSYTGKIYEHDARLGVKNIFDGPAAKPVGLAWVDDTLWVADGEHNTLWRLNRTGVDWEKKGPFAPLVFAHNRNFQLSGFTVWKGSVWIVSEAGGVLIKERLPKVK